MEDQTKRPYKTIEIGLGLRIPEELRRLKEKARQENSRFYVVWCGEKVLMTADFELEGFVRLKGMKFTHELYSPTTENDGD